MIVRSKNFRLKLAEILKDELPLDSYNETEVATLKLIQSWYGNKASFTHQTSGSTGFPKAIEISRDKVLMSAKATLSAIDPDGKIKTSLLCLSPSHIGGAMVVYRAIIYDHDLTIVSPSSNPLKEMDATESFDLASLVPIQFKEMKPYEFERFRTILIGGAPMPVMAHEASSRIYATYGMTETVSHIALRKLEEDWFVTTGDTVVEAHKDHTLMIKGPITDHEWLHTHDIAEVKSNSTFRWIGRKDFIINSGGIKVNPEQIELQLKEQISGDFVISWIPDSNLGQQVVLIANGEEMPLDMHGIDPYHQPKRCFWNRTVMRTASGKVDRLGTQKLLLNSIGKKT